MILLSAANCAKLIHFYLFFLIESDSEIGKLTAKSKFAIKFEWSWNNLTKLKCVNISTRFLVLSTFQSVLVVGKETINWKWQWNNIFVPLMKNLLKNRINLNFSLPMLSAFAAANLVSPLLLNKHFTCHVLNQLKGVFACMSYTKIIFFWGLQKQLNSLASWLGHPQAAFIDLKRALFSYRTRKTIS